jgi:hypothetical protein
LPARRTRVFVSRSSIAFIGFSFSIESVRALRTDRRSRSSPQIALFDQARSSSSVALRPRVLFTLTTIAPRSRDSLVCDCRGCFSSFSVREDLRKSNSSSLDSDSRIAGNFSPCTSSRSSSANMTLSNGSTLTVQRSQRTTEAGQVVRCFSIRIRLSLLVRQQIAQLCLAVILTRKLPYLCLSLEPQKGDFSGMFLATVSQTGPTKLTRQKSDQR